MRNMHILKLFGVFCLLCFSQLARGLTTITVDGPINVCKNSTWAYSTPSPTPGVSYSWSMSTILGNFSTTLGASTNVLWNLEGTTTIKIQGKINNNVVEEGTKVVTVRPLPQPIITTDYRVACQTFPEDTTKPQDPKGGKNAAPPRKEKPLFTDDGPCPKVCEDSWVTYTAVGDPSSTYTWTVSGGTAYPSGNTCVVHWGAIGLGSISVKETTIYGCEGTKSGCIDIIGKPHAKFGPLPDPANDWVSICLNDWVIFKDFSYVNTPGSPIVSWFWDFGDGHTYNSSTTNNPTHQYTNPGGYTVMLVVKNACNCADTAYVKVEVRKEEGVQIVCPSVACEKGKSTYSLKDPSISCASYNWGVIGGTITSPMPYGPSIDVVWDNVDDDGFGYIVFDASHCAIDCPGLTTVKIPVIKMKGLIKGETALCPNKQYKYVLPAWPGTFYNWTLSGGGTLSHTDQPNEIVVTTPGYATGLILHCTYTNSLVKCGGKADLKLDVMAPNSPSGDDKVCLNNSATYTLTAGGVADWTMVAPDGSVTNDYGVPSVSPTFTQVGTYSLTATGSFCSTGPFLIKVLDTPPAPNSITGPDTACAGVPYEFTAGTPVPGTIFEWSIGSGTIQGANTGKTVTVIFSGAGPYTVSVRRRLVQFPYCPGPYISKTLTAPNVVLHVSGKDTVCPNSVEPYTAGYYAGDAYEWTITSAFGNVGSINNNLLPNISVTWNNQTSMVTATLTLKVTRCGNVTTQNFPIVITPAPVMSLIANDSVCRDAPLSVNISSVPALSSATLTWSVNGSAITSPVTIPPGGTANTYTFTDISSGNLSKTITATITNPNGCISTTTLVKNVIVKPAPVALVTPIGPIVHCGGFLDTLTATLQAGAGATSSLAWSTSATTSSITTSTYGSYYVIAYGTNGCNDQSNIVNIVQNCAPGCVISPAPTFTITNTQNCGHVKVNVQYSATNFSSGPAIFPSPYGTGTITNLGTPGSALNPASVEQDFAVAGNYNFIFDFTYLDVNGQPCVRRVTTGVVVPLVPDLLYTINCTNGVGYTVSLINHSTFYPGTSSFTYNFSVDGGAFTSAPSGTYNYPSALAPGSHTLTMAVGYSYFNGTTTVSGSCTTSRTLILNPLPVANYTVSGPNPACVDQQSLFFNNMSTNATSYLWNFADGSTNILPSLLKTFNAGGTYNVVLKASNDYGCFDTKTIGVPVIANNLANTLSPSTATICEGSIVNLTYPVLLPLNNPTQYDWYKEDNMFATTYPTTNFIPVMQSGAYWVHVSNQYGCWKNTFVPSKVSVLHTPDAVITGDSLQCSGNTFTLDGYAGSDPGISYYWTVNGGYAGNTPSITQTLTSPGIYDYQLTVTVVSGSTTCSKTSSIFKVLVNAPPAPPYISFNVTNCDPYTLDLQAIPNNPGTYNWSNSYSGNPITVSVGGPYKVWYTDLNGCTVSAEVNTPKDINGYTWIFPTGCYVACPPITIPGPIIPFYQWAWYEYGTGIINSGTNSVPASLNLFTSGQYGMYLNNGYCDAKVGTLDLTVPDYCSKPCDKLQFNMEIKWDKCKAYPQFYVYNSYGVSMPYILYSNIGTVVPSTGALVNGMNAISTQWIPPAGFYSGVVNFYITVTFPDGTSCTSMIKREVVCPDGGPVQKKGGTTGSTTGSSAMTDQAMLTLAPNPAQVSTTISYHFNGNGNNRVVEVYDMTGRKLASHTVGNAIDGKWNLSLDNFASGLYQVVMKEGDKLMGTTRLSVTR